jgi:Prokaryotic Cytochrome C oxidase subunit IV
MTYLLCSRATALWLVLVALTILSLEFLQGLTFGGSHRIAAIAVIIVAFAKVRLVGLEYMELRTAPLPLRLFFEVWVLVVMLAIIIVSERGASWSSLARSAVP